MSWTKSKRAPRNGQPWGLRPRCGIPGRQASESPFNKLVSGVRTGSEVHEILHFWRTDLFKLRGDQHGGNTHQLPLPPWDRAAIEILVDQTLRKEQSQGGGACSSLRRRPASRSGSAFNCSWRLRHVPGGCLASCSRNKSSCIGCSYSRTQWQA